VLETDVRSDRATPYRLWIAACTAAEMVGMTAAAGAATLADGVSGPVALGVVVAGGLVEGTALGLAQATVLARVAPALSRVRYLVATVVVAGLGWAAATAPSTLGGGGDAEQPPVLLVVLGALALGLVLGSVLGAVQAYALRGAVRHPTRWVAANAAAWPVAMILIFVGATLPDTGWPAGAVLLVGAVTGAAAGAALGLVSGLFLPTLSGVSAASRVVLALLVSHRPTGLQRALLGLEVRGRVSGRRYRLPVQYAVAPGGLAVVPGRPSHKTWWRNLNPAPTPVEVLREGVWAPASARCLGPDDPEYDAVLAAYLRRWPDTPAEAGQPVVLVRLGAAA
jgi:deazaflavin-dependent oxidoreductase (nitroreductase family)